VLERRALGIIIMSSKNGHSSFCFVPSLSKPYNHSEMGNGTGGTVPGWDVGARDIHMRRDGTGRGSNWSFDTFHDLPMPLLLLDLSFTINLPRKEGKTKLPLLIPFFTLYISKCLARYPPPASRSVRVSLARLHRMARTLYVGRSCIHAFSTLYNKDYNTKHDSCVLMPSYHRVCVSVM
jgi:hypothetical protein